MSFAKVGERHVRRNDVSEKSRDGSKVMGMPSYYPDCRLR